MDMTQTLSRNGWMADDINRRERFCLIGLLILAFALRFAAALALNPPLESDMLAYDAMARNLLAGKGVIDPAGNYAFFNMGYPFFVLAPIYALSDYSLVAVRLANSLLGAFSVFLCWWLALEAGFPRFVRLLSAAIYALYLPTLVYAGYLFKEHLLTPLVLLLLWASLRMLKQPTLRLASLAGVLCGLIALVGNAGLACAGAMVVAIVIAPVAWSGKLKLAAVMVLATVLVCTPWLFRNQQVLGHATLNTNGGFNLYLGNNPAATGEFMSIADTAHAADWQDLRRQGEWFAANQLKQDALAWIAANPMQFIALGFKKLWLFWQPPMHSGQRVTSPYESMLRQLWLVQYVLIVVVAGLGAWAGHRAKSWPLALIACASAGYSAAHMVFYSTTRYRETVMPLLCVLAAFGVYALLRPYLSRRAAT